MIALALLATAPAALQIGEPIGNIAEWIRDSDNAKVQARAGVLFQVTFNPEGKPDRCVILQRTGDASADALACSIIFKRFRTKPSLGADGLPIYMVFRRAVVFSTGGSSGPPPARPRLAVVDTTGTLSAKEKPKPMALAVAVDKQGGIIKCAPGQWQKPKEVPIAEAACRSLPASWKPAPEVNAAGEPIEYLVAFEIEFSGAVAPAS